MKKALKWILIGLLIIFVFTKYDRFPEALIVIFEPRASGKFDIKSHNKEKEFQCFEYALHSVSDMKNFQPDTEEGWRRGNWDKNITKKDFSKRLFETGEFGVPNRIGKRVRVHYEDTYAWISINATGIFMMDLGADIALEDFSKALIECINKKD
ncbi:MAG: hypothetical protein PHI79_07115 [Sulfurovaceae bacterium]|nr:hypothetical protein [Sulfurovaceae bacterium]MDD5549347.1 hypothetical protein [Sulfurovaceae bacterium]